MSRSKIIVNTSLIGILFNLLLTAFKFLVGIFSNSIAITVDALNNLSDALSSFITIVGTKLALKQPDKMHPFGHGRIEYIGATTISIIIIYAGIMSLVESIKKIINPPELDYSFFTILVVVVAIIVKIFLGIYVKKVGEKVNSESLIGSGQDALMDVIISITTLVAAIIYLVFNISLEAWLGIFISFFIMRTGYMMLKTTLSSILGERIDKNLSSSVKKTVNSFKEVYGAYDLFLNNYGPDVYIGSIHIEVDESMNALEIDTLSRKITEKVLKNNNVLLVSIGIYSLNTKDEETIKMRNDLNDLVCSYKEVLQMHGFYFNKYEKKIYFDIIIDYEIENRESVFFELCKVVSDKYPDYKININLDIDASD